MLKVSTLCGSDSCYVLVSSEMLQLFSITAPSPHSTACVVDTSRPTPIESGMQSPPRALFGYSSLVSKHKAGHPSDELSFLEAEVVKVVLLYSSAILV